MKLFPSASTRGGSWHLIGDRKLLSDDQKYQQVVSPKSAALEPTQATNPQTIDVVFPVLHGTYGEDGTVQGLLKLANIPFVGASVLGSAVGMDKDVQKRLLRDAGIPTAKFFTINSVTSYPATQLKNSLCS